MTLHRPQTLDAALELAARGLPILAGGTDLYPALRDGPAPDAMLDLTAVAGLRGIALDAGHWRIGAATTWTDIIRAGLPPQFAGLVAAAREVGSVQIQNTATVAGNLCNASPAADGVPPLLTLDAEVELAGRDGLRRLPLARFITGVRRTARDPGEIVTAIHIPDRPTARAGFVKLGARRYLVISIAMTAVLIETEGEVITRAAVAVGACSPVAQRLATLETALTGARMADMPEICADTPLPELTPIDDIRASAAYRITAPRTLIARALTQALSTPDAE
ncbi:xanthine dehydrogenase [Pacificitalea manganoxidans]|uniref:Xanthine dehydrogenase n=1 Tax=Pacificitalea manganoxidans TaxID=1411902 RepID=A0A291M0K8_9RHOB|nr:xanthine dehydrogenase family protein subunit M [Pacificitalea manganoxidans]ATI42255.1 xanthine dehydrogenase [Pacificitalea manganoxidans]MDR6307924.1 CO/xanthine dehydrogenase FAD-binding subunit [Pacificitalea manganoxidans]